MKLFVVIAIGLTLGGCGSIPRSDNFARNTADGPAMAIGQSKVSGPYVRRSESSYSSFGGRGQEYYTKGTRQYLVQWYDSNGVYHQELVNEPYAYGYSVTNSSTYGRGYSWGVVDDPRYIVPNSTVIWPAPKR